MTETATLATQANKDVDHAKSIINKVYRQVFGNRHLMELDINTSTEALFMNGDLNVQGFVTAVAQSDTYRKYFLEPSNPYRFIELNFKHLLGRAPRNQAEVMEHVQIMADEGFDAEIASYTYSEEYLKAFGFNQVPFMRSDTSRVGYTSIDYSRSNLLKTKSAGFDGKQKAKLLQSIALDTAPKLPARGIGMGTVFVISWVSCMQLAGSRRAVQRSVVPQTSLSSTVKSIQSQRGTILEIATNKS
ncbi:phycoerythrin-associated linker protein [cyanobiont of Ornithocercus magnificus]|nr:phycoerythrin-associated linker protein [cyanobiont of Ornithocercus magnificus]